MEENYRFKNYVNWKNHFNNAPVKIKLKQVNEENNS